MKPEDRCLTGDQVRGIVKMLGLTTDHELNCGQCLQHVSEFAEGRLANNPAREVIAEVERHLALCSECREEYEALVRILKAEA